MHVSMRCLFVFIILTLGACLRAHDSLQSWIKIFPDANTSTEAKADKLTYGFYFVDRGGASICLILEASIKPEWLSLGSINPEEANFKINKYEGFRNNKRAHLLDVALSKPQLKFFARSTK